MKYFNAIKTNKQIRNSFLAAVFVYIIFFLIGFMTLNYIYDTNLTQEAKLADNHFITELDNYTNILDKYDIYLNEDTLAEFTDEEFQTLSDSLFIEDLGISTIAYAPSAKVKYVYPSHDVYSMLDNDLFFILDPSKRAELEEIITTKEYAIFMEENDNGIVNINLYKPLYTNNEFNGFIILFVNAEDLPAAFSIFGTETFNAVLIANGSDTIVNQFHIDITNIAMFDLSHDVFDLSFGLSPTAEYTNANTRNLFIYVLIVTVIFILGAYYVVSRMLQTHNLIKELNYRTNFDEHTDILNYQSLSDDIDKLIKNNEQFFFAFGSVNNLKYVFNKFGHTVGEKLLLNVAFKVKNVLSMNTEFYRYGGDEFVFVIKTVEQFEVKNILDRVLRVFDSEVVSGKLRGNLSISLGVVNFPFQGRTMDDLINKADIVMSSTKTFNKNSYVFFKKKNIINLIHNQDFDTYLSSVRIDKFEVYLMPIVNCVTNQICGFEALSRLFDRNGTLLNIPDVIESLERNGRIQELDEYVFKKVCEYKVKLDTLYDRDYFISTNVSGLSFNKDYVDNIIDTYEHYNSLNNNIIVELTESYNFDDAEFLHKLFKRLERSKIKLALDDFGTGFSSLSYLSKLPLDVIKIDRSFIQGYKKNVNRQLIQMVQNLSKTLEVHVVAEGVDSYDQLKFITSTGCKYYQGYLYSEAVDFDGIKGLIEKEQKENKRGKTNGK